MTDRAGLLVVLDARFAVAPDGSHWAASNYGHAFWQQYLTVFDRLTVAARCGPIAHRPAGWLLVDGPGVSFCELPAYAGPTGFVRARRQIRELAASHIQAAGCVLYRGYGAVASALDQQVRHAGIPVGLEVLGDPSAALRLAHLRHPAAPVARLVFTRALRRRCRTADAVAYVTESYLQDKYPPGPSAFSISYSDVSLTDADYAGAEEIEDRVARLTRRLAEGPGVGEQRLVFVGSLATRYKGLPVLLAALQMCRDAGRRFTLEVLGDGQTRPAMERLAGRLGLAEVVHFRGAVPQAEVRRTLLASDLMILPSQTEGMPRALLEAMAACCPVIATKVGGVPELLSADDMVPPGDPRALSRRIEVALADPAAMLAGVRRNHLRAREFEEATLQEKRGAFCRHLHSLAGRRGSS